MRGPRNQRIVSPMTPFVKALLVMALVVPLVAYVAGTLSSTAGGVPEQQGTVWVNDVDPASETEPSTDPSSTRSPEPAAESTATPSPSRPSPTRDNRPTPTPDDDTGNNEARVVTPAPVEDDDDDDDGDDDDRDDTDDGDDTDD